MLDGLDEYVERLDRSTVVDKVWPNLITGFADTVPVIREATVKAIFPLSGKLSERILNNDLLRLLAKMQTDPEPSIRTNTCILLGRLAPTLGYNTKKKVLVPAFARSLKDSFVHARVAALMALMATVDIYERDDLASRVIPNMAFALVDKEKIVRDQAFKALSMFVKRIETEVASMVSLLDGTRLIAARHCASGRERAECVGIRIPTQPSRPCWLGGRCGRVVGWMGVLFPQQADVFRRGQLVYDSCTQD